MKLFMWILATLVLALAGDPTTVPQVMSSSEGWYLINHF